MVNPVRATLEVNTPGPLCLSQILSPLLRKSPDGRIVNVSLGMGQLKGLGSDSTAYASPRWPSTPSPSSSTLCIFRA